MSKPSVKDRVTAMTREVLGPEMQAAGFRRAGRLFWRDGPDTCQVVNIVMNPWGSRDDSTISIALGVFWHRVEAILENSALGMMPPPVHRCTFRIDLGRVISMPPKPEWRVTQRSNYEKLAKEVWHDLRDYGFAWLNYRSDLKRVLEWKRYTTPETDGTYSMQEIVYPDALVVFKVMLGKKASALADLERVAKNGYANDASKLARKLHLPTREIDRARAKS